MPTDRECAHEENMMHTLLLAITASLATAPMLQAQRMLTVGIAAEVTELDLTTGTATPLGTMSGILGATDDSVPAGLTYDLSAGHLYAASSIEDQLYVVDQSDWRTCSIGSLSLGSNFVVTGLEWDAVTGKLFGVGNVGGVGRFFEVNATTGAATVRGNTGLTGLHELAFDPVSSALYLSDTTSDQLYTVDRATGATTLIGPLANATFVDGMAHNLVNLTMYACDRHPFELYQLTSIDLATGTATTIGGVQPGTVTGMALVLGTGRLLRQPHGCGGASVFVTGSPNLGGLIELRLTSATGLAFVGFGVNNTPTPFCGCTIGHEWAVAMLGPVTTLSVPSLSSIIGLSVFAQGLDLGGTGGCSAPTLTLTDTIEVQIGN